MPELEIWKNVSRGKRGIIRLDQFGRRSHELVSPGRQIELTKEDRVAYERNVSHEKYNIFKNGALIPLALTSEEDMAQMNANPNFLTDEKIGKMFKTNASVLEESVNKIENELALERMLQLAEESESITVKKYNLVKGRLDAIREVRKEALASKAVKKADKQQREFDRV